MYMCCLCEHVVLSSLPVAPLQKTLQSTPANQFSPLHVHLLLTHSGIKKIKTFSSLLFSASSKALCFSSSSCLRHSSSSFSCSRRCCISFTMALFGFFVFFSSFSPFFFFFFFFFSLSSPSSPPSPPSPPSCSSPLSPSSSAFSAPPSPTSP